MSRVRRRFTFALIVCSLSVGLSASGTRWTPCVEFRRELRVPCKCTFVSSEKSTAIEMNCDRAVLTRENVDSLRGNREIVSFGQRNSGHRELPEDLLNAELNLRTLDLSGNSIDRLTGRRLLRAQIRLEELRLADNLLGDGLNPIFSSSEFHGMKQLKLLDLSRNGLRNIEEGILKGCENLEQLYLDGNGLTMAPTLSLKGPKSLRVLSLSGNNIGSLSRGAFSLLGESLLRLDVSENELSHMEDGALAGLEHLLLLNISRNDLSRFNSDVFKGANKLLQLDLSTNFLREFPSEALRHLTDLKFLNLSNNLLGDIEQTHLSKLSELQILDLSRNNIGRLGGKTFSNLSDLIRLDLSLNALRTIEESSFDGLVKLEWLSLQDNNILLVPATSLTKLPSLTTLRMEFNRVAALPIESIEASATNLITLSLTRNLVREIPGGLFQDFERLSSIELSGNALTKIDSGTFVGLEDTLLHLDISSNKLSSIEQLPLSRLISLNLADNRLTRVAPETFASLVEIRYLNLSSNPLYGGFPPVLPDTVIDLDVSRTDLPILPAVLLLNLKSLEKISVAGNRLQTIEHGTFDRLINLSSIDLSGNRIERIEDGAFIGLTGLYRLNLRGNRLTSFSGEHFDTGTGMEILDLSNNEIDRLSPTAFVIHPRLRTLDLSGNRFVHFPGEYLKPLQFLESLDLAGNSMKRVVEFAFSQLGHLRTLNLSGNKIESIDELAFHNSTQLQLIDLSGNAIETLSERTMEGLLRVEHLNLRDNRLASLPETIFDPSRVRVLEGIDLSGNRLTEIPVRSLQRQAGSLSRLNLARNRLMQLFSQEIASGIKELDLSDNPLSANAVNGIMGEARILRSLNLANTGIERLSVRLEAPFLRSLNLSGNSVSELEPTILERVTMLETLDVSRNKLVDLTKINAALKALPALRWLNVSGNRATSLTESSLDGLNSVRTLDVSHMPDCTRIEKNAFKSLSRVRFLFAHGYPKLGYFDVQGILKDMASLETLDIEIKDSSVGNEQLSMRTHPRLREVILRGERLNYVLSSSLVGVRAPKLVVGLRNTSVDSIPAALFFPVPRSTELELDITGSKFTALSAQVLTALDERSGSIKIRGLGHNPVNCNCDARHLWRWLKKASETTQRRMVDDVRCSAPDYLAGSTLFSLAEDQLSCDPVVRGSFNGNREDTGTTVNVASSSPSYRPSYYEPEIIWTVAPAVQSSDRSRPYNKGDRTTAISPSSGTVTNATDDTLIIGIVAGVVTFIALIVIVIFVCRFRWWTGDRIDRGRLAAPVATSSIPDASMIVRPSSVYSGKVNRDLYLGSYNGSTLDRGNVAIAAPPVPNNPVHMMPFVQQPIHYAHTLLSASPQPQSQHQRQFQPQQFYGYCDATSLPMYIACPTDNKGDR